MPNRSCLRIWITLSAVSTILIAAATPPPPMNQKIIAFAREHIGKKVGNGECITLATEALRAAGAKRFPFDRSGDFRWGSPVDSFRVALPGDILQFRDAVFRGKRYISRTRWVSWHDEYPHHTAIVAEVSEGGRVVTLLHQNVGSEGTDEVAKRVVQKGEIRPDSLQKGGTVWIFRPIALTSEDSPEHQAKSDMEDFQPCSGMP